MLLARTSNEQTDVADGAFEATKQWLDELAARKGQL